MPKPCPDCGEVLTADKADPYVCHTCLSVPRAVLPRRGPPLLEGEPDRAEVLEEFADDLCGVMQPDSTIEVYREHFRYHLRLERVEKPGLK